jgi:hypothetical protein
MWGGRGGKEMGTFTSEKGIWECDALGTKEWRELETKGDSPEPRSFHTMCAVDVRTLISLLSLSSEARILNFEDPDYSLPSRWMSSFWKTRSTPLSRPQNP